MFNLDHALSAWRRSFAFTRAFDRDDLDELEAHLVDQVEDLIDQGIAPREAFETALRDLGDYASTETEYRKVYPEKRRQRHTLLERVHWNLSMLRNYLKVAVRHLWKQKGYTALNIAGLAVGLAACTAILLYVHDELTVDRHHEHVDEIYRVGVDVALAGMEAKISSTAPPTAETLLLEYPDVEASVRLWAWSNVLVEHDDRRFYERDILWADSTVFDVFSFELVQGNPRTALARPHTVVLTESAARKYFGDESPMGQTLRMNNELTLTVTGVAADPPANARLRFDLLGALTSHEQSRQTMWLNNFLYTYVRLRPGADPLALEAQFPDLMKKYVGPQVEAAMGASFEEALASGVRYNLFLEPLAGIYLRSVADDGGIGATGDIRYVVMLLAVAGFILAIACINFVNLTTARSAGRAKEVGMRKVLGSNRGQLVRQFLGESVVQAVAALVVAFALVALVMPAFNGMAGKALGLGSAPLWLLAGMIALGLGAGLAAGVYPAFVLSSFRPVAALRGGVRGGRSGTALRGALVVTQFALAIVLIVGTGVVMRQVAFLQEERLGITDDQVVVMPVDGWLDESRFETLRQRFEAHPQVAAVAASSMIPGRTNSTSAVRPEGAPNEQVHLAEIAEVSPGFLDVLELEVAHGRALSGDRPADRRAWLVNETAAYNLGWEPETAVGKQLIDLGGGGAGTDTAGTVVGVVRDFHFESMHDRIRPLAIRLKGGTYNYVTVRVRPERVAETIDALRAEWEAFEPAYPFRYSFLDEDFGRLYGREKRLGRVFGAFTMLALVIACLGLFGLAAFVTRQRTKEIGVRKVLGASVAGIVLMLSKSFTRLVLLAAVIAFPAAYLVMDRWLAQFAYHVELGPGVFLMAGGMALAVAVVTVGSLAVRAARANPVQSLRYE